MLRLDFRKSLPLSGDGGQQDGWEGRDQGICVYYTRAFVCIEGGRETRPGSGLWFVSQREKGPLMGQWMEAGLGDLC